MAYLPVTITQNEQIAKPAVITAGVSVGQRLEKMPLYRSNIFTLKRY
jgi:hypothetical protein